MLDTSAPRMSIDSLHLVSVVIFITQMAFILKYYAPLMGSQDQHKTSADGDAFISDFLFSDDMYRSFMTLFISLQLVSCALLVWRWKCLGVRSSQVFKKWVCAFCVKSMDRFIFYAEVVLFGCTWIGWITLCSDYSGSDGTSPVHVGGVAVFISGSFIYFSLMTVYIFSRETGMSEGCLLVCFVLISATFLVSCITGIMFIDMAIRVIHDAWIYEHLSYVLFCACHILLFAVDQLMGMYPYRVALDQDGVGCELPDKQLFERVRIQFNDAPPYRHTAKSLAASRLLCL